MLQQHIINSWFNVRIILISYYKLKKMVWVKFMSSCPGPNKHKRVYQQCFKCNPSRKCLTLTDKVCFKCATVHPHAFFPPWGPAITYLEKILKISALFPWQEAPLHPWEMLELTSHVLFIAFLVSVERLLLSLVPYQWSEQAGGRRFLCAPGSRLLFDRHVVDLNWDERIFGFLFIFVLLIQAGVWFHCCFLFLNCSIVFLKLRSPDSLERLQ